MTMRSYIFQDTSINSSNKAKFILIWFRLSQLIVKNSITKLLFFPLLVLYRVIVEWFMGTELPWSVQAGRIQLFHGQSLIINPEVIIGDNCTLRCNTVIGNKVAGGGVPKIGNNVDIGANSVIIGEITIGDNATIGAGAVVGKSIPENFIAIGNPARVYRKKEA